MGEAQDIFGRKFNLIQDQIGSMMEKIEEDKLFQQEMALLRQQEIDMLNTEVQQFFNIEVTQRKEMEASLVQMIDDKTQALRTLITKESKNRYENVEEVEQALSKDLPELQSQIKKLQTEREKSQ